LLIEDSWRIAIRPISRAATPARAYGQWSLPMKPLEFEKISVSDARRQIDGEHKRNEERKRTAERAPQGSSVLLDETSRWMAALPADVRPIVLARTFPRIANSVAELWRRVARCEEYLDSLVVDVRGDRSGFPPDVARELTALRNYYTVLHPQQGSTWDLVARDE